ncbi:MAG: phage head closure protein [Methylophilaceae bacterium]
MSMPAAGELNRRVEIKIQNDTPAMGAAVVNNYSTIATVWAKHQPVGNAIFFGTKQVGEGVTDRFIVRYNATINEKTVNGHCVIQFDETLYRVRRASDLEGMRQFLMIEAERLGNA